MPIWRLMTHHESPDRALAWTKQNGRIAIGWGKVGDIRAQRYSSPQDISASITELFKQGLHLYDNAGQGGVCLWNFYAVMKKRDLVILNTKDGPSLVVEVMGDYEYIEEEPLLNDYLHQRPARIVNWEPKKLWRMGGAAPIEGQNGRWTLIQCRHALPGDPNT